MLLQKILHFIILPSVFSYHFYKPLTNDILTLSSLDDIPPGYKLLPPPKNNRHTRRGNVNGICVDAGFTCTTPFAKSLTFQFECDQDRQCPATYKCCQQKCFLHKICSKSISTGSASNGNNNKRPGSCERWPYSCPHPYQYHLTSGFKCNSDRQCPRGFKCCEQNCFLHKVCSKATATPINKLDQKVTPKTSQSEVYLVRNTEKTTTITDVITETTAQIDEWTDRINPEEEEQQEKEYEVEEEEETEEVENGEVDNNSDEFADTEDTTESLTKTVDVSTLEPVTDHDTDLKASLDKPSRSNMTRKSKSGSNETHDTNAINPEYEAYYYHYGGGNGTAYDYDDYDDEEEEE